MDEVKRAALIYITTWVLLTAAILLLGQRWARLNAFRDCLLAQWKPALVISGLFLLGMGLAGRGFFNVYALAIFCESLVGLALARGIPGFEPLPVAQAVTNRQNILRPIALTLIFALLAALVAFFVGNIGLGVVQQIAHEANRSSEAVQGFVPGPWQAFWAFLAGAGIAEESMYRLVLIPLIWRVTRRPWIAVVISAVLFGAYHLTPLSGMYRTFLQFPVSQFTASALIGLIWGWLFLRRGYEASVLAHTLSNWVPLLIFMS